MSKAIEPKKRINFLNRLVNEQFDKIKHLENELNNANILLSNKGKCKDCSSYFDSKSHYKDHTKKTFSGTCTISETEDGYVLNDSIPFYASIDIDKFEGRAFLVVDPDHCCKSFTKK